MEENNILIFILFVVLFTINASSSLLVRYSQGILKEQYIKSAAVFLSETIKLVISVVLITIGRIKVGKWKEVPSHFFMLVKQSYWMFPSAFIYLILNILLFFCLSHLNAVVFSVLYQLKMFASALMTIVLLRRKIPPKRWLAIFLLFVGVTLVKIDKLMKISTADETKSSWIGLIGVIFMAFCSGLGGVYFELVLKNKRTDDLGLWERNFQLYLPSVVFSFGSIIISDLNLVMSKGFFSGMSYITLLTTLSWAFAGLTTSLVLNYGSSVLNSFGGGMSMVATAFGSFFFQGFDITLPFLAGSTIVFVATVLYQLDFEKFKESINGLFEVVDVEDKSEEEEDPIQPLLIRKGETMVENENFQVTKEEGVVDDHVVDIQESKQNVMKKNHGSEEIKKV